MNRSVRIELFAIISAIVIFGCDKTDPCSDLAPSNECVESDAGKVDFKYSQVSAEKIDFKLGHHALKIKQNTIVGVPEYGRFIHIHVYFPEFGAPAEVQGKNRAMDLVSIRLSYREGGGGALLSEAMGNLYGEGTRLRDLRLIGYASKRNPDNYTFYVADGWTLTNSRPGRDFISCGLIPFWDDLPGSEECQRVYFTDDGIGVMYRFRKAHLKNVKEIDVGVSDLINGMRG